MKVQLVFDERLVFNNYAHNSVVLICDGRHYEFDILEDEEEQ